MWQPIETYKGKPRGGHAVFYFPEVPSGRMTLGALTNSEGPHYGMRQATHWMPLPDPPQIS